MSELASPNTPLISNAGTPAERLAEAFYRWEARGRGWLLWDEPVHPEPPFTPFRHVGLRQSGSADDGQCQTPLSRFVQWVATRLAPPPRSADNEPASDEDDDELDTIRSDVAGDLVELWIAVPRDFDVSAAINEQFLLSLSGCKYALSFEVIGLPGETLVQVAVNEADTELVRLQLAAHFPGIIPTIQRDLLAAKWGQATAQETIVAEFGLLREFMLPLAPSSAAGDGLTGIIGAMEGVADGEIALLQVMFEPVRHPWASSILRSIVLPGGEALFGSQFDVLKQARGKVSRPLYAAVIRIACRSGKPGRGWTLARHLTSCLTPLGSPLSNELIALENDDYNQGAHVEDVPLRRCRRSGMILNSTEVAALVHLPSSSIHAPKLRGAMVKTKAAPASVLGGPLVLGENNHGGETRVVTLAPDQRVCHVHVVGGSGTGKTTLLLNMIMQDIRAGEGVAVLDPHGDLIDDVIARIHPERTQDVVLFDPADEEYPVGFNVLSAHSTLESNLLASDLIGVFRRLSSSWGDQLNAILANGILAFLESSRGGTLLDLRRFLVEQYYRHEFLKTVNDPEIVYYWRKEFPLLKSRPQGPVLTRLDAFLRPKAIRFMVGQKANRLDFARIMDGGKIFLARLSHGAIGHENAHLLGALLVSKFHQLALGRQQVRESERKYFWLYMDEFQHFATPSMAEVLSGVRKYRLGLVLAHQELHQLESRSPELASAVLSNAHTRICFRVGDHDARKLESGFSSFEAKDLQNLGTGEAICRVERANMDFNLRTSPALLPDERAAANIRRRIISNSRQVYARQRSEVELELTSQFPYPTADETEDSRIAEEAAIPPQPVAVPPIERVAPVASSPARKRAAKPPTEPAATGRGGPQHRYIQQLIKQYAEGLGFRASIEDNVLDGKGVDVALVKGATRIACEICITTDDAHELQNIRKCLAAGFEHVVGISPSTRRLAKLQKIGDELPGGERQRVRFLTPDQALAFIGDVEIRELEQASSVRGYKVKTTFQPLNEQDRLNRRQAVSKVVAKAMQRLSSARVTRNKAGTP